MNVVRLMTEDDRENCLDFIYARVMGWTTALSRRNRHGHIDGRFKETKQAGRLMLELLRNRPSPRAISGAFAKGRPLHSLWPERLQEHAELWLTTPCPVEMYEPTSAHYEAEKRESGNPDWKLPSFLRAYGLSSVDRSDQQGAA